MSTIRGLHLPIVCSPRSLAGGLPAWILVAASLIGIFAGAASGVESETPPNVVVVFCDDLGYSDVGSFGAKGFATPHLDRMAAEGIRFTRFYSAQAVCSASRAALMTGCYPNRVGIKGRWGRTRRLASAIVR